MKICFKKYKPTPPPQEKKLLKNLESQLAVHENFVWQVGGFRSFPNTLKLISCVTSSI